MSWERNIVMSHKHIFYTLISSTSYRNYHEMKKITSGKKQLQRVPTDANLIQLEQQLTTECEF